MSNRQERDWQLYISDMQRAGTKVLTFTQGLTQSDFVSDPLVYDATLRNLELIGEAARNVPNEVREAHPEIQWRLVIATRNQLIHGYLGLDDDIVWSIIRDDVPLLLSELAKIAV